MHRVFERHDIRCTSGGNFSQAVANHCVRHDAPGFHKLRQSIFNREQCRLGVISAVDQRIIAVCGKNHLEQASLKIRLRQSVAAIHSIPKNGVRAIQLRGHASLCEP